MPPVVFIPSPLAIALCPWLLLDRDSIPEPSRHVSGSIKTFVNRRTNSIVMLTTSGPQFPAIDRRLLHQSALLCQGSPSANYVISLATLSEVIETVPSRASVTVGFD